MNNKLKLTLPEFTHIYNTIHSVYNSDLIIDLEESAFYSIFAATILKNHYNFNAIPLCGDALFYFDDNKIIEYNEKNKERNNGENHCLVLADGWFFDFTSPNMTSKNKKMIQLKRDQINQDEKGKKGYAEFWHVHEKMSEHLIKFNEDENLKELCKITNKWFNKNIKKMDKKLEIIDKRDLDLLQIFKKDIPKITLVT